MKVESEEYVYPFEVLQVLEEKDEENLSHEQKIAFENLTRHTKIRDLDTLKELNRRTGMLRASPRTSVLE